MHLKTNIQYILRFLIELLLFSNIWIALGVMAQTFATFRIAAIEVTLPYLHLVFCGTVCLYSTHGLLNVFTRPLMRSGGIRTNFIRRYWHIILFINVFCLLDFIYQWQKISHSLQLFLLAPIACGALYVLPILGKRWLRDFSFIKIFTLVLTWQLLTVGFIFVDNELKENFGGVIFLILQRTFLMFALCLLFDIRDSITDNGQTQTFPLSIGERRTKQVILVCLLASLLFSYLQWKTFNPPSILFGLLCALQYSIAVFLTFQAHSKRNDYFFNGWVDGLILSDGIISYISTIYFLPH